MTVKMNAGTGAQGDHPPEDPFIGDFSEGLETGLYLALLELIDEGLIITGDEVVLEANSAACRLLERDYRQIAGKPLADLFPSERAFLEARARLFIQGEMRGSLRISLPGGRQRDVRFIAAARIRPGVHALILSPDVIAETYSETRCADSLWPRLAAALEQPVIVVDEADTVAAANAVALNTMGRDRASLVGHPARTCLDIEWPEPGAPQIARLRINDQPETVQARVLPGPRQGWRVLVLPTHGARQVVPDVAASRQRPAPDGILDPLLLRDGKSIDFRQLEIHFQPLIDTRDGRIRSGEALLRWSHPELGLLPFGRFRNEAHERGILAQMGDWVLRTACTEAAAWPESDDRIPGLTVNIANDQVFDGSLAESIAVALDGSGINADRLELDFEAQILNEASEVVFSTLTALRRKGVRLAIDDFGLGLAYIPGLKHLPIGAIKLDRTLVGKVGRNEDSEAIVQAIAGMANILGLEIFARGVESKAQQAFLAALGCHLQQGPLFGPPMTAAGFRELLARNAGGRSLP